MSNLKTHVLWALVTVVSAAAWGKWVLYSREPGFVRPQGNLQQKLVEPAAAMSPLILPAEPTAATPAAVPAPAAPELEYEIQPRELPTLEEIRRLLRSSVAADAWNAYQAISQLVKSPLKTELLRELLKSKEESIRQNALHLLHDALGGMAAAPLLHEFLRSDPSVGVREAAARLSGYSSDAPGTLEALLAAFQKDELRVQVACAGALSDMGHPGPAAQLLPRLAPALENPDGALRRQAVEMMGQLRCPQSMALLTRALRDTNGDVRLEALNSLWNYDDPQAVQLLEPLLHDPVSDVRETAQELIRSLKGKKE